MTQLSPFLPEIVKTALKFCINNMFRTRRMYGESCPVFCPNHYRPVCGASQLRSYMYRTFVNGCHFDMLNCRGDDISGNVDLLTKKYKSLILSSNVIKPIILHHADLMRAGWFAYFGADFLTKHQQNYETSFTKAGIFLHGSGKHPSSSTRKITFALQCKSIQLRSYYQNRSIDSKQG